MLIICPVDVKYKGVLHKAHTQFNCDSSDFQKFQPLGAWAFVDKRKKVETVPKRNIQVPKEDIKKEPEETIEKEPKEEK